MTGRGSAVTVGMILDWGCRWHAWLGRLFWLATGPGEPAAGEFRFRRLVREMLRLR